MRTQVFWGCNPLNQMTVRGYADALKAHLSKYKLESLGVTEAGRWRGTREYPHILPEAQYRLNIVASVRQAFWDWHAANADEVPLHIDFAHLNSSQAFAFNLLFPWCETEASRSALLAALGIDTTGFSDESFERMPDPAERTTLDFHAVLANGGHLLIEVKLTEGGFGPATRLDTLAERRAAIYEPMLIGKFAEPTLSASEFAIAFQLVRNLAYVDIARGDHLVLIVPKANLNPWTQAEAFLDRLTPAARDRVRLVAAEYLVARLGELARSSHPRLATAVDEVRAKYFPASGRQQWPTSER